jgi:predicted tellurium resistance membrane protein TerC
MELLTNPEIWIALLTLTALEIVLGVDNVIFISILASKLPKEQQERARKTGILAAAGMRLLFLLSVGWIITLKNDLFTVLGMGFSGKDIILILGGLFLMYKATKEIHEKLEGEEGHIVTKVAPTFAAVIGQIMLLDLVFSIDSVITAVGMTPYVGVMVTAVLISVAIMLFASKAIYDFVNKHPAVKMLALSFLLLIGVTLVAEGLGQNIPKGYIYFSIAFAVFTEWLNIRASSRRKTQAVHLHSGYEEPESPGSPQSVNKDK